MKFNLVEDVKENMLLQRPDKKISTQSNVFLKLHNFQKTKNDDKLHISETTTVHPLRGSVSLSMKIFMDF